MAILEADVIQQVQFILQDSTAETLQRIKDAISNYALPQIQAYHNWDWRISAVKTLTAQANKTTPYSLATDVTPAVTDFDGMISMKDITNKKILDFLSYEDFDLDTLDESLTDVAAEIYLITADDEIQFYPWYNAAATIKFRHKKKITVVTGSIAIPSKFFWALVDGSLMGLLPRVLPDKITPNQAWLDTKFNFFDALNRIKAGVPRQSRKRVRMKLGSAQVAHLKNMANRRSYAIG